MTQPLALVLYEKLLPGSQLVNRLQDLNYRVRSVSDPEILVACAQQEKPIVILVDLGVMNGDADGAIRRLKQNPETKHIPVIAFGETDLLEGQDTGKKASADVFVNEGAILAHLPQLLERALRVE